MHLVLIKRIWLNTDETIVFCWFSFSPIKSSGRLTSLHHHLFTEASLSNATEKWSSRSWYIFQSIFWLLHNVRKLKNKKYPFLVKLSLAFMFGFPTIPTMFPTILNTTIFSISKFLSFQFLTYSHRWLRGKESAFNAGDMNLITGLGRSPGEGNCNSLQYYWLENSMDSRAWQATVHGATWTGHDFAAKPPPLPAAWSYSNKL